MRKPASRNEMLCCDARRDELVQHRILEHGPPLPAIGRFTVQARVRRIDPVVSDRGRRSAIIGTNFKAVVEIFAKTRAPARAQQQHGVRRDGRKVTSARTYQRDALPSLQAQYPILEEPFLLIGPAATAAETGRPSSAWPS